jgi:serine/threonine protein kinase
MDQHDLETGIEIGDFRIERRLGAGGMGIVYRARQVSLGRAVALKILGAALTREADRMRFQREAQAVAKLDHPGIASVYFIGQDRQVCYMAMEFIDGPPLRQIIDRLAASRDSAMTIDLALREGHPGDAEARQERFDQPTADYPGGAEHPADGDPAGPGLPTPQAKQLLASRPYLRRCCEVVAEAATALAHAHERGVVHRDVKPENILIDRQGRVHLIDFGVARFLEDVTLTNTGTLVGTPMYMSPEQVTGRLDLDGRTDVYSLGLVLYELLTLTRPIAAPTREGILRQVATKALPPASWRNPALPRNLEGVLHKATARDPDDRYQTAADLAADLRRWLDGRPVDAPPYRYRLDPREIKAERPAGIMVLAFAHFLASALSTIVTASLTFLAIALANELVRKSMGARDVDELSSRAFRDGLPTSIGVLALSSAGLAWIGFGLLTANRWARRGAVGLYSALAAWAVFETGRELFRGGAIAGLGFELIVLALSGSTIAYLSRRSVRDWFVLAARLRVEHRGGPGTSGGRAPKA